MQRQFLGLNCVNLAILQWTPVWGGSLMTPAMRSEPTYRDEVLIFRCDIDVLPKAGLSLVCRGY
jgi:hypothetical protein